MAKEATKMEEVKIDNPEQLESTTATKGFTLKPGAETTVKTCWGTTRVKVTNTNKGDGKFWFRAGIHPVEEHYIDGESSQVHDRLFGPLGAFVGNNGKVSLYFETSC